MLSLCFLLVALDTFLLVDRREQDFEFTQQFWVLIVQTAGVWQVGPLHLCAKMKQRDYRVDVRDRLTLCVFLSLPLETTPRAPRGSRQPSEALRGQ